MPHGVPPLKCQTQSQLSTCSDYPCTLLFPLPLCIAYLLQCPILQITAPSTFKNFFLYYFSSGRHSGPLLGQWQQNTPGRTVEQSLGSLWAFLFSPGSQPRTVIIKKNQEYFSVPFKNKTISGIGCQRKKNIQKRKVGPSHLKKSDHMEKCDA